MASNQEYKGRTIERTWNGYKIVLASGARYPETYGSIADAQKSIDFDVAKGFEA